MQKKYICNLNYFAIVLIVIKNMLHYSTIIVLPSVCENVIEIFAYSIWGITLLTSQYKKKYLFMFFLCGCVCIYSCYICKSFIIFSSFMFFCLCMSKKSNEHEIINIIYKTIFWVLLIHFFAFLIQYLNGSVSRLVDKSGRIRLSLGFSNPNIVSYYALWCFLGYVYSKKELIKEEKRTIMLPIALITVVYIFAKSNTLLYMTIISLLLLNLNIPSKILSIVSKYAFLFITFIWIILVGLYSSSNTYAIKLNNIMNSRLYYSCQTEKIYGYSIIGKNIDLDVGLIRKEGYMSTSLILDVTYANLLYKYGIIYVLILALISVVIANCSDDIKKKYLLIWCIFALSETVSLNFVICFPPVFAAFLLKERRIEK